MLASQNWKRACAVVLRSHSNKLTQHAQGLSLRFVRQCEGLARNAPSTLESKDRRQAIFKMLAIWRRSDAMTSSPELVEPIISGERRKGYLIADHSGASFQGRKHAVAYKLSGEERCHGTISVPRTKVSQFCTVPMASCNHAITPPRKSID